MNFTKSAEVINTGHLYVLRCHGRYVHRLTCTCIQLHSIITCQSLNPVSTNPRVARSAWRQHFVLWRLTFVGPQYGTFGNFVHPFPKQQGKKAFPVTKYILQLAAHKLSNTGIRHTVRFPTNKVTDSGMFSFVFFLQETLH